MKVVISPDQRDYGKGMEESVLVFRLEDTIELVVNSICPEKTVA